MIKYVETVPDYFNLRPNQVTGPHCHSNSSKCNTSSYFIARCTTWSPGFFRDSLKLVRAPKPYQVHTLCWFCFAIICILYFSKLLQGSIRASPKRPKSWTLNSGRLEMAVSELSYSSDGGQHHSLAQSLSIWHDSMANHLKLVGTQYFKYFSLVVSRINGERYK